MTLHTPLCTGLVPSECFCFKSAQLPLCLSFTIDVRPVHWRLKPSPQQHLHSGATSGGGSSSLIRPTIASPAHSFRSPSWPEEEESEEDPVGGGGRDSRHQLLGTGGGGEHRDAADRSLKGASLGGLPGRTGVVIQGEKVQAVVVWGINKQPWGCHPTT